MRCYCGVVMSKTRLLSPAWWVDGIFLMAVLALGVAASWPIYADPWFFGVAGVGIAVSCLLAWQGNSRRWNRWKFALAILIAYVVLSVPVAYPTVFGSPRDILTFLGRVLLAPITGWMDILTLDLPLGTYQATLAPFFLLCLIVPLVMFAFAWRTARFWGFAGPVSVLPLVYGVVMGSSAVRGRADVGPLHLVGASQIFLGVAASIILVSWMWWRMSASRSVALRVHAGPRRSRNTHRIAAIAMLTVAGVASVAVTSLALDGAARQVPRTAVIPDIRTATSMSPLVDYRKYFTDDAYDAEVFSVNSDADRVRIAAMSVYDGTSALVDMTAFKRVPSHVPGVDSTSESVVRLSGYDGVWLPMTGDLASIDFDGPRTAALFDNFFYHQPTATGVELAESGTRALEYHVYAATPSSTIDVTTFVPGRSGSRFATQYPDAVPESVTEWMDLQGYTRDGAGLLSLIESLRNRGFLSHSLLAAESSAWMEDAGLSAEAFQPSRAGHSSARIDALFTALLERQYANADASDAELVAAVGDDEQFAVAAAMIADHMGFDVRIVLGARLADTDSGLPTCTDGVCAGGDIAVWIEVQDGATGQWAPIDVTPQSVNPVQARTTQHTDPRNNTDVEQLGVNEIPPPDSHQGDGEHTEDPPGEDRPTPIILSDAVRIAGVTLSSLLLLALPLIAIFCIKVLRRRGRRQAEFPAQRMVGAWEEYVDTARDLSIPVTHTATRKEMAEHMAPGSIAAQTLAERTDWAVFSADYAIPEHADATWELAGEAIKETRSKVSRWRRIRAVFSLASLRGRAQLNKERRKQNQGPTESRVKKEATIRVTSVRVQSSKRKKRR